MRDADKLIVNALKTLENDPTGPKAVALATAYASLATAMLLREFLGRVPIIDDDDDVDFQEKEEGPIW